MKRDVFTASKDDMNISVCPLKNASDFKKFLIDENGEITEILNGCQNSLKCGNYQILIFAKSEKIKNISHNNFLLFATNTLVFFIKAG